MMGGYDIEHAMMLLIPEAWEKNDRDTKMKDYYQYYSITSNLGMVPQQCVLQMEKKLEQYLTEMG